MKRQCTPFEYELDLALSGTYKAIDGLATGVQDIHRIDAYFALS